MSIFPLPVFEADADPHNRDAMTDREIYERLEVPDSLVVRFGSMKMIGEFPYDGDIRPGCGTKLVARTFRGTEIVEMLTTTCVNAGCGKSLTRQEMLEYIENSGGKDFPFHTQGRILRVATVEDLNRQASLEGRKRDWVKATRAAVKTQGLEMKVVDVEPILGEEVLTVYFTADGRVDFRALVRDLAKEFATRIEMRQVGARDEARLVADYERCGQHCCCKNFLKVLKPVSMKAAKMQKATLDPLKISGRCGRLMCCLRYEDVSYRELKARLPKRKTRVGTPEGPGVVLDGKILAQLVLVRLDHNREEIAVPIEDLTDPDACPKPGEASEEGDALRGMSEAEVRRRTSRRRDERSKPPRQDAHREKSAEVEAEPEDPEADAADDGATGSDAARDGSDAERPKRRGRRGGRRRGSGGAAGDAGEGGGAPKGSRRRRRRGGRKRRGGSDRGGGSGGNPSGGES